MQIQCPTKNQDTLLGIYRGSQMASQSLTGALCLEGVGPVVAGVFSALFVLLVLVLMYHCCRQNSRLGRLKPFALPSKLRQHFRYDGVPRRTGGV